MKFVRNCCSKGWAGVAHPGAQLKPYPCCRCNHTSIGLGIGLHANGLQADNVDSIEIHMGNVNWLTVGEPYQPQRDSVVHAQFNASYGFARALTDGRVDLRTYQRPQIHGSSHAALTARTSVISDPAIEATAIEPARVKIRLKDGRSIRRAADTIKGSPQEPLTRGPPRQIPRLPGIRAGRTAGGIGAVGAGGRGPGEKHGRGARYRRRVPAAREWSGYRLA